VRRDFRERYGPWAVVAGGSEGIGEDFADQIAAAGVNVVLLARRIEPLERTADQIRSRHGVEVRTVAIDLTDPDVLGKVEPTVADLEVGLLIYNAGAVHGAELFARRPVQDAIQLIDLNCRTVALLAHHFARPMSERGRGGIVLMTSMSSAAGAAYTAVYNATKAFDFVLAEGLWMELGQVGVDVIAVPAGLTDTPAMRRSGIIGRDDMPAMRSAAVAKEALDALGSSGPIVAPGAEVQAVASQLWPVCRADLVQALTAGAAALYDLPTLAPPTYP
jgi:short-subunit dehydrogenase